MDNTKPVSITINGNDVDEKNTTDIYENYIIKNNQRLQNENDKLKDDIRELNKSNEDLEEQLDKEEKSKTYMKGLMHNLYDMKNKSLKVSNFYQNLFEKTSIETKELIKKPLDIYLIPNTNLRLNIREYYILSFLIMPFLVFVSSVINIKLFLTCFFLSIYPGTVLYYYMKNEINNNNKEYEKLYNSYSSIITEINEIKKDIEDTERSCTCLDNYIDEL